MKTETEKENKKKYKLRNAEKEYLNKVIADISNGKTITLIISIDDEKEHILQGNLINKDDLIKMLAKEVIRKNYLIRKLRC